MVTYLYSTAIDSSLFDEQFRLITKKKHQHPAKACENLVKGLWVETEKSLMKDAPVLVGWKSDKVKFTQNIKKLEKVSPGSDLRRIRVVMISVTRDQVKQSITEDLLIAQSSHQLDDTQKILNMMVKRARDWYDLFAPEVSHKITENEIFIREVNGKNKEALLHSLSIRNSMGRDFSTQDIHAFKELTAEIISLYDFKKKLEESLEAKTKSLCPNLSAVTGERIAAKLVAIAGSLERLAILPASTVQLLGAERALFRHLRDKKQRPPKYGILHEHPIISRVRPKDRGRAARAIADKCAIAARVDYFKGKFIGDTYRRELEAKFP